MQLPISPEPFEAAKVQTIPSHRKKKPFWPQAIAATSTALCMEQKRWKLRNNAWS